MIGQNGQVLSTSNAAKRGLVHMLSGLAICLSALLLPRTALLICLAVATFCFLLFELIRFGEPRVNRWFLSFFGPQLRENEASQLTGSSYMLIASLAAFAVFQRDIAVLSLSFLAVGDATASIVGTRIGKRRLLGKTLEGDLACILSCLAVGSVFYWYGLPVPFTVVLTGALVAGISEALPLPVNDNLTMPLLAGTAMTVMQL